jgi:hypothetical protein
MKNRNLKRDRRWLQLKDLIKRTRSYESMPVPFDSRLRGCIYLSQAVCLIALGCYWLMAQFDQKVNQSGFFLLLKDQLNWNVIQVRQNLTLLLCINGLYLCFSLWLMVVTANFRHGQKNFQIAGYGLTVLAGFNILAFTFSCFILLTNLLIWLALLAVVVIFIFLIVQLIIALLFR